MDLAAAYINTLLGLAGLKLVGSRFATMKLSNKTGTRQTREVLCGWKTVTILVNPKMFQQVEPHLFEKQNISIEA